MIALEDDGTKHYEKMRAAGSILFVDASSAALQAKSQVATGFKTVTKK
ncbi:MAG: hypothetical protein WAW86_04450 [Gammaproteobacteria bacterium]